jgi:hypothetical protein
MNYKAKASKAAAAVVVGLAAGIAATTMLVSELAADVPDSTTVERQQPLSERQYTGPRTADAADAWLEPGTKYTGPTTPDAAEHWFNSGTKYTGPTTPDAIECWFVAGGKYTGPTTADAAAHWLAYC